MRQALVAVAGLFLLAAPCAAGLFSPGDDATVGVDVAWWTPELDTQIKITDDLEGTDLSLERDLGIEDEDIPWASLWFQFNPKNRLTFSGFNVAYEGDKVLGESIIFSDSTYDLDARVESEFDLGVYDLEYMHMFGDPGAVRFGLLFGVKVFDIQTSVAGVESTTGLYEETEESIVFPVPVAGAVVKLVFGDIFSITAKGSGLGAGSDQIFYDASALAGLDTKHIGIMGGYRIMKLDVEADDDFVDIEISGPAAVVSLRF